MNQADAEQERRDLAGGLRRADPEVLDRLIEQHQHRLFRYLVVLSGNPSLAEDLFQETWLRVLERRDQYDAQWRFETWLYTIARNLFIDHTRRRTFESLDALAEPLDGPAFEPVSQGESPFERVASGEQGERVSRALVRLAPAYREVLVLRFQDDLPLHEIARVVQAALSTVKSRLYRGLDALRRLVEESGGDR